MTQPQNLEPPYDDIFKSYSLTIVSSPPQPVDERDIKSGARNIWNLTYVKLDGTRHEISFKLELDGLNYLRNLAYHLRYYRGE